MRHPHLKPSEGNRVEELERRLAAMEARIRRMPVRDVTPGATATTIMVQQSAHGFVAKDVLRHNGTSWTKAQGDTAANAVVGGMVVAVPSPDVFILATGGYVAGLSGLTAGSVHYLSAATAGLLTTTAPSIAVSVLLADSTTSGTLMSLGGASGPGDGTACTVLGRSANSTGVRADISAADGTLLGRSQGSNAVAFSNNPIVVRDSQNLSLCMIATFSNSTTAPTRSATKGEMYFIY